MLRPKVIEVIPNENYELYLKFNNGEEKVLVTYYCKTQIKNKNLNLFYSNKFC
jgi:hypothetical protein